MTSESPFSRSPPPPSIRSAASWWSDRNSIGATFNLHALAKPLMGIMYHREVRKLLNRKYGEPLWDTDVELMKSYLLFDKTTPETKTAILHHLCWRMGRDSVSRQAIMATFASPDSGCLILRMLGNLQPGDVYDAACGLLASICGYIDIEAPDVYPDLKLWLPYPGFEELYRGTNGFRALGSMLERVRKPTKVSPMDRVLRAELLDALGHLAVNIYTQRSYKVFLRMMDDAFSGTRHLAVLLLINGLASGHELPRIVNAPSLFNFVLASLDRLMILQPVAASEQPPLMFLGRAREGIFNCLALMVQDSAHEHCAHALRGLITLFILLQEMHYHSNSVQQPLDIQRPLRSPTRRMLDNMTDEASRSLQHQLVNTLISGELFTGTPQRHTAELEEIWAFVRIGIICLMEGRALSVQYAARLSHAIYPFPTPNLASLRVPAIRAQRVALYLYQRLTEHADYHFEEKFSKAEPKQFEGLQGLGVWRYFIDQADQYQPRAEAINTVCQNFNDWVAYGSDDGQKMCYEIKTLIFWRLVKPSAAAGGSGLRFASCPLFGLAYDVKTLLESPSC
ncbi:Cytochrome P450 [Mycena kentingensis (nom. inval.)]|nr:Cytochrome P450 [Mycena kentingensis (nom. inval.)]